MFCKLELIFFYIKWQFRHWFRLYIESYLTCNQSLVSTVIIVAAKIYGLSLLTSAGMLSMASTQLLNSASWVCNTRCYVDGEKVLKDECRYGCSAVRSCEWLGDLVTWWLGDLVTWWLGDLVTWWLGDLVTWWLGDLVTWWTSTTPRFTYGTGLGLDTFLA